jgi:undecaprenyl-diphosphatase
MSSFLDTLKSIDNSILLFINGMHSPFWDNVMMGISNRFIWIPLYLFLIYLMIKKYGKNSWLVIGFALLAIGLSDQVASHLIKNMVMRYRPSYNLILAPHLHIVGDYLGGQYGFVSSHASNTFGLTDFIMLLMPQNRKLIFGLFCWAALVCYSRMYLGVHYPSDIVGGAIVGAVCAWVSYKLWAYTSMRLSLN